MVSCGATFIKYLLFFFNLIWLALGGTILYFGFKITGFSGDLHGVVDYNIKNGAIVVLAAGFLIFLIAFLGCCGAIKESSCMLSTYGGIILILVVLQCVGAYFAFKYRTDIKEEIEKGVLKTIDKFRNDTDAQKAINKFQKEFECCGAKSYKDWDGKIAYPGSCCNIDWELKCSKDQIINSGYDKGCVEKVTDQIEKALGGLGGLAIGLILIQLLIIVSACCLAREVK